MSRPRSVDIERAAYAAATPVLAMAPNLAPTGIVNCIVLGAGGLGALGTALVAARAAEPGPPVMYLSPLTTALAVDVAAITTPGMGWDWLIAGAWATIGSALHPLSGISHRRRPAPGKTPRALTTASPQPPEAQVDTDAAQDAFTRGIRRLWERAGNPGRSYVVKADRHDGMPQDATLLIRSAEPGRRISSLAKADVAAAFGIDESDVAIAPVARQAGRLGGPGWLEVHLTPDASARRRKNPTDTERWTDRIGNAGGGAPGSVLTRKHRNAERGVTFYQAEMADPTDLPKVDLAKVCRGLGIKFDDSCVFLLKEDHQFLLSVFDEPPLSRTFPATRELLTPDEKGMYVCGIAFTGQPVKSFVWQHDKNAAAHGLTLGVTRSGKTQYFAISAAALSLGGGVVWLTAVTPDEKTTTLGQYVDRQGSSALYMVRALRAAQALCEIRAHMPWTDGRPHDFKPGDPRCPYRPLKLYLDEFMSAAADETYGEEIQRLGDVVTMTGLKYGIGLDVAGQSLFAHNGFSTEMKNNLRQNSRPVVFNMGSPAATRKALEGVVVDTDDLPTIPARYAKPEGSAITRAMNGEADPDNGVSTGGVAIIVPDNGRPILMRSLYADFDTDLSEIFPDEINRLTDHEIRELEARDLWGDWNRPEDPDLDDEGDEVTPKSRNHSTPRPEGSALWAVTTDIATPEDALSVINDLSKV
ncbi:chromosome segregation protein ParM [Yinghuangia aomiensis]